MTEAADDAAKLVAAVEKLTRETERLRADVLRVEGRLRRETGTTSEPAIPRPAAAVRTVPEALRAIGAASDAVEGCERSLQFLRSEMDLIWRETDERRRFGLSMKPPPPPKRR